jgi:hypothetical protein
MELPPCYSTGLRFKRFGLPAANRGTPAWQWDGRPLNMSADGRIVADRQRIVEPEGSSQPTAHRGDERRPQPPLFAWRSVGCLVHAGALAVWQEHPPWLLESRRSSVSGGNSPKDWSTAEVAGVPPLRGNGNPHRDLDARRCGASATNLHDALSAHHDRSSTMRCRKNLHDALSVRT